MLILKAAKFSHTFKKKLDNTALTAKIYVISLDAALAPTSLY